MAQPSTQLANSAIQAFQGSLHGRVLTRTDTDYDQARRVWNAQTDKRPALVAYPVDTAGVVQAVNFARDHNLLVAVRGGSHSMSGFGVCDGGLVIDMSSLKSINIDPDARTAVVGGGILGRELGAAASQYGLALPLGQMPSTGIAGVMLGGGIGWLTRQFGLSIDSLLSAEVVTASGQVLTASATENSDLFWALRGGGGNFGIVTRMEVQLRPVSMVVGGIVMYPIEQTAEVLRAFREFAASTTDTFDVTIMVMCVPPIPVVPPELHGRKVIAVGVCYAGPIEQGLKAVQPLRTIGTPLADIIGPMPFAVLQNLAAEAGAFGMYHDIRSGYLQELSDAAIDVVARHVATLPPPFSQFHILQLGGAASQVAPTTTAYPHRDAPFLFNVLITEAQPEVLAAHRTWMEAFARDLRPFSTGGVYVNFLGDEGHERVRAAYGLNYDRLLKLKQQYDPNNFFRQNQNLTP